MKSKIPTCPFCGAQPARNHHKELAITHAHDCFLSSHKQILDPVGWAKRGPRVLGPCGKLKPGDKGNFETIKKAVYNGDLAIVASVEKVSGEPRTLICAMNTHGTVTNIAPLGVLIWGDPFELFVDPTVINDEPTA